MRSLFPLPLLLVFFFVLVVLVVVVLASAEDESSRKTALLSNFQGRAACFYEQRVAFPRNEAELKTILSRAEVKVVKAVSANAHSWNEKFWCGRTEEDEDEESIVNVFVNDLRVVGSGERRAHLFKGGFEKKYVSVDAGMKVRSMLEYIAEHGYALKSVPWFIDQTVGGALATCSHGSTLVFGSLSSQVVGLRTMFFNGTVETITERTHGVDVMDAFRCHVNQLGITLAAIFEVFEANEAQRTNRFVTEEHMLHEIELASAAVRRCIGNNQTDWWRLCAMRRFALRNMDDLSYYHFVPTEDVQRVKIRRKISESSRTTRNAGDHYFDANEEDFLLSREFSSVRALEEFYFKASAADAENEAIKNIVNPNSIRNRLMQNDDLVSIWTNLWQDALEPSLQSFIASNASTYLVMTEEQLDRNDNYPFDQAEIAVPLTNAGECLRGFVNSISESRRKYWRSPALIRFLNAESALLSPAHKRPSMYVNIENYKRSEEGKAAFGDAIRYLTSSKKCDGRLHFGKFGWGEETHPYSLYDKYGEAYCKFLCMKDRYDPMRRFETREISRIFARDLYKCKRTCD